MYNEKLGTGAVIHLGTCHGNRPAGMRQRIVHTIQCEFSLDILTGAAGTVSVGITALHHKSFVDTMKGESVVKAVSRQLQKVLYGNRRRVPVQLHGNLAIILHRDLHMMLAGGIVLFPAACRQHKQCRQQK